MAVGAITGTVIAVRTGKDPVTGTVTSVIGNITIKLDDKFGGEVIHVRAVVADIAALTVGGTCSLTFAQP